MGEKNIFFNASLLLIRQEIFINKQKFRVILQKNELLQIRKETSFFSSQRILQKMANNIVAFFNIDRKQKRFFNSKSEY